MWSIPLVKLPADLILQQFVLEIHCSYYSVAHYNYIFVMTKGSFYVSHIFFNKFVKAIFYQDRSNILANKYPVYGRIRIDKMVM